MLRGVVLAAAAMILAGCESLDTDSLFSYAPNTYPPDAPAPVARADTRVIPEAIRASCESEAESRATAASDQGFDQSVQQTVREQAYADCLEWQAKTH